MKVLAVGCSYTYGFGLDQENNDPKLWINQVAKELDFDLTNLAEVGRNNDWIFQTTASEIMREHYDLVIVAWTTIPRYAYSFGLELWNTWRILAKPGSDVHLHDGMVIKKSELDSIGNKMLSWHNDHWDIVKLITYVNVLTKLQLGKVVFVNAMGPWDEGFFNHIDYSSPSELGAYTNQLLDINGRSDDDVRVLYNKIHNDYSLAGSIQQHHWLNLYSSLRNLQIDTVAIDAHPGYASQDVFADHIGSQLKKYLNENSTNSN